MIKQINAVKRQACDNEPPGQPVVPQKVLHDKKSRWDQKNKSIIFQSETN